MKCLFFLLNVRSVVIGRSRDFRLFHGGIAILLAMGVLAGCTEDQDPAGQSGNPTNPGNPSTPTNPVTPAPTPVVEIASTSPEFVFWGDELTLTGKGFSTKLEDNFVWLKNETASLGSCPSDNRTDSTGWRKATVLRATATSLTIKIPYKSASEATNNRACGVIDPMVSVTVGGKRQFQERSNYWGFRTSAICATPMEALKDLV